MTTSLRFVIFRIQSNISGDLVVPGTHYHLWFRSIRVGIVRNDSHSARDTNRLFTVRHSIKLKEFHVLHAHPGRVRAKGGLEGHPGSNKINRLSPSPYNEGDRY